MLNGPTQPMKVAFTPLVMYAKKYLRINNSRRGSCIQFMVEMHPSCITVYKRR